MTVLLVVTGLLAAVVGLAIGAVTWSADTAGSQVERLPDALPSRPDRPPAAAETITFLVVGVDHPGAGSGDAVAEAVMLVRAPADRSGAQVVYLPPGVGGAAEVGSHSSVAGLLEPGGTVPFVEAVEGLTGVRVDHVGLIDFSGFQQLADALGGVTVDVPEPYTNQGRTFAAGPQRMDGAAALAYVRSRDAEARASAGARLQLMVDALFARVAEQNALTDLGRLGDVVGSLTRSLTVDDTLDNPNLVSLAWKLRDTGSPAFVTAPTDARADALWEYLRTDTLQAHLDEFG